MFFSFKKFVVVAVVVLHSVLAALHASCGSSSCPIDTHSQEKIEKGMVRLDYSYEYIDQDEPRMGRHDASVGEISGHHDEISTLNETHKLSLDLGLTSRLNVQAVLPFIHREHAHTHNHMGSPELSTWNFNGMGDLTLLTRYAFLNSPKTQNPRVSLIGGGVLPTGRDHAMNSEGEEAEPGILPGKDAYSLILGLSSLQQFSVPTLGDAYAQMPFFLSTTYQWNGKGHDNYRIGNIWLANAGITYPLFPKVGLTTQVNLKVNEQDDQGQTHEEVEKTGGTYVYVSPGLQFTMAEGLWSYFYLQLPVYQRVNEIQLTSNSNFLAGISYRFSAL